MKKAFFINGGAGRVLCALPALEYHIKNIDPTAIVIAEGWEDLFLACPTVSANVYPANHKNLLNILKDRELISPEPYRLNAYFNQKCNLVQAFDMLINYDTPPEVIPEPKPFNFVVGKTDAIKGYNMLNEIRTKFGKDRVVVFQPFGRGVQKEGNMVFDPSGRSFELQDANTIIKALSREYAVVLMSEINPPSQEPLNAVIPQGISLLQWMGIIQAADYFVGCDSVGQHMANALGKPATVVIGSTFPENISYPGNQNFTIIDNGKDDRKYSPIRLGFDVTVDRNNENLMYLENQSIANIANSVYKILGKNTGYFANLPKEQNDCCGGACETTPASQQIQSATSQEQQVLSAPKPRNPKKETPPAQKTKLSDAITESVSKDKKVK